MISSLDKTRQQKNLTVLGKAVRIKTHFVLARMWSVQESHRIMNWKLWCTCRRPGADLCRPRAYHFGIWVHMSFAQLFLRALFSWCAPSTLSPQLLLPAAVTPQLLLPPLLQDYLRSEQENLTETSCLKLCVSKFFCFCVCV